MESHDACNKPIISDSFGRPLWGELRTLKIVGELRQRKNRISSKRRKLELVRIVRRKPNKFFDFRLRLWLTLYFHPVEFCF